MSSRLTQWVDYLKSKHRTDTLLPKWFAEKYYTNSEILNEDIKDDIERINDKDLTVEQFYNKYSDRPVIIQGAADTWAARDNWTFKKLL